jgi:hypothetical protein
LTSASTRALKLRLADRVLRDHVRGRGAVWSHEIRIGPAVFGDDLAQPRGVFSMHRLHARRVSRSEFPSREQFLANAQILRAHGDQFVTEGLVHASIDYDSPP